MTRNVLIIEDNPGIGELVRMHVAELDRVLRLEMEADDYLTKPFSVAELSVRVKALFQRVDAMASASFEKIRTYLSACIYRLIRINQTHGAGAYGKRLYHALHSAPLSHHWQ